MMNKEKNERQILATGLFYHPGSDTYGGKIKSCIKAGYADTYAEKNARKILGLDVAEDTLPLEWQKTIDLLPQTREMIQNWLKKHKDKPETQDIKEARGLLRLYGELEHRFIKTELRIEAKKEEIHYYLHFDTKEEEIKHYKEIKAIADNKIKELIDIDG